jgi:Flp pilus assembly protein TadD
VEQALREGYWDDAARALADAEKQLGDAAMRERLAALRRDLFTAVRLDEIRHEYPVDAKGFDTEKWVADYRETFRRYGLDPEHPTDEMRQRGRASPIRMQLAAALDAWARGVPAKEVATEAALLDFANSLDDSALRREVRAAVWADDRARLVRLAKEAETKGLTPSVLVLLASALDEADESEVELDLLRRGRRCFPDDFDIVCDLGCSLAKLGESHMEEALDCFRAATALRPMVGAAHGGLAACLVTLHRIPEAEQEAREAVRLWPESALCRSLLGGILLLQGQLGRAETALGEALHRGECVDIYINLGQASAIQHKWPDAEWAFRRGLALEKSNPNVLWRLGDALYHQDRLDEAESYLRESLRFDPERWETHATLGFVFQEREQWPEAEAAFRGALRRFQDVSTSSPHKGIALRVQVPVAANKDLSNTRAGLSYVLLRQGKTAEADAEAREAIRLNPSAIPPRLNLGEALLVQNRGADAEAVYREILWMDEKQVSGWTNLATALALQGRFKEVEPVVREAVHHVQANGNLHNTFGFALVRLRRDKEAEAEYRETLRLEPRHVRGRGNLLDLLKRQNRYDDAIALVREALSANPDDVTWWGELAKTYAGLDEPAEVEKALREVMRLAPGDRVGRLHLASFIDLQGRFEDVAAELRAMKSDPSKDPPGADYLRDALGKRVAVARRLPGYLSGAAKPSGYQEALDVAWVCLTQRHGAAALRFFEEGFRGNPFAAEDTVLRHRFGAATAAVLAGTGQGDDAPADEAERARLRRLALKWMSDELHGRAVTAEVAGGQRRGNIWSEVVQWQHKKEFAAVRGPELAKLPDDERAAWAQFWEDVESLRKRIVETTP